jgi:hypothetical protein
MKQHVVKMPAPEDVRPDQFSGGFQEQVRHRAYELYEARGKEDGHDAEDWLRAESEVAQKESKSLAA